ncbi:MAG: MFS transporter [Alphaproteobacteria bacterium]|nr:MFS transporter [Alphaproteobacteria bacterium]
MMNEPEPQPQSPLAQRDERRALAIICAAVLIDTIGFGIIIPVLPAYLRDLTGATLPEATRIAGWLVVTFAALQFLFGPVMGNLSDRFGRRPVLLIAMAMFGVNYLLMGLATNLVTLFIGRALTGISGAIYAPANAYMADVSPPEKRAQRFALIGAAFGVGFILGPALGGLLGSFDPRTPFFVAAGLAGLNAVIGFFLLRESLPRARRRAFEWRRANPLGAFFALRKFPAVLGVIGAMFLWQVAFHIYPSTWSFFATLRYGWSEALIGLSLATAGVWMVVVQGALTGRIVRAIGERMTAFIGVASFVLAALLYVVIPAGWMVFLVQVVAAGQGVAQAAMQAIISKRTPPDQQGELQGGVASLMGLGAIAGPLAMTQTLAYFTDAGRAHPFPGAAFLLAAAIAALAGFVFAAATRPAPHDSLPEGAAAG